MKNSTGASIARQSMIKMVVEVLLTKNQFSFKDSVAITNVLVDWVENGYSREIGERLESIDEYLDRKVVETMD